MLNPRSVLFQVRHFELSNGLRETLLQKDYGKSLLLIEGFYQLKIKPDSWLTFEQIERLMYDNFGMSRRTVYFGLQVRLIFQRRVHKVENQRGRPPYLYRVPDPLELEAEYTPDANWTPSDPLQKSDLRSVHTYRLALHREMFIRKWIDNGGKGFRMFRALMAERLGVCVRTVRDYDKLLKFSHVENFKRRLITWDNWNSVPRYKQKFDENGTALPQKKWLQWEDWYGKVKRLPLVRFLAYQGIKHGVNVYEVEQLANTYYPYQRPNAAEFEDADWSVDFYYADREARYQAGFAQAGDIWFVQRE